MSQTFKHDVLLRVVKIANVILITIPFALSWFLYYSERMYFRTFYRKGNWVIILLFLILYVIFGKVYDAFLVSFNRISEMIYSQSLAAFIADALMFVVISLLTRRMPNLLPIMLVLLCPDPAVCMLVFSGKSLVFPHFCTKTDVDCI